MSPYTADLLIGVLDGDSLARTRECTDDQRDVFHIAIVGWSTIIEDILADDIAVGLGRHPNVRISNRTAIDKIDKSKQEEHSGRFDEATIQRVGEFRGIDALGVITVRNAPPRTIVTVHLTCTRTLLNIVSARTDMPSALVALFRKDSSGHRYDKAHDNGRDEYLSGLERLAEISKRRGSSAYRELCKTHPDFSACSDTVNDANLGEFYKGLDGLSRLALVSGRNSKTYRALCKNHPDLPVCSNTVENAELFERFIRARLDCTRDPQSCCSKYPDLPQCIP
ncbi:hypothetical protein HY480_03495 [Candidatus Uhrbacteria bacterium]|nr:hypothetical protein [Candidatus Uhrbacteria bacterium]